MSRGLWWMALLCAVGCDTGAFEVLAGDSDPASTPDGGGGDTDDPALDLDPDDDGFSARDGDCAPNDPKRSPGAAERCNERDDDCDGEVDEQGAVDGTHWYPDDDGDGLGDPAGEVLVCRGPEGYVEDATDCYDGNAEARPGAVGWHDVDRGDGSFDWNCDGVEARTSTTRYSCVIGCVAGTVEGWRSRAVPTCGSIAAWGIGCQLDAGSGAAFCAPDRTVDRTQACQ